MENNQSKHTPGKWVAQSRAMSDNSLVVKDAEFNEISAEYGIEELSKLEAVLPCA